MFFIGDAEKSANELVKPDDSASKLVKRGVDDLKSQVSEIGRAVRNLSEQLLNQQSRDVSSRTLLFTNRERTLLRSLPVKQYSLTLLVCAEKFYGSRAVGWGGGQQEQKTLTTLADQSKQQRQEWQKQYQKHWSAQGYRNNSAVHHQQCPQVKIIMVQFSILKSGRP